MLVFRFVFGGLLIASLACLSYAYFTGNRRARTLGLVILKWTLLAGAVFFGVLMLSDYVDSGAASK